MKNYLNNDTLDNLLEGFQLISYDWRYLYVNKAVASQGKSTPEELLGYTMMEKYPGIENTEMFKTLQKCMNERVTSRMENEFTYPDGTSGWFELRIEPVSEGLFILSLDISEQKNAQKKLETLNESLEQIILDRTADLEMKNKRITDSVQYAKRIQDAKLPDKKKIYEAFPQSFILYKPKDIVSGDFYYFQKSKEKKFIASADCTGHGVPGALLSMLCMEKLNHSIILSNNTSEILSQLNKEIKISLRQTEYEKSTKDGMDIALCSVDTKKRIVEYAGANRPIWIIRKGHTEIEEIRGTKTAIGGYTEDNQHFDTHEVKLEEGDTFYLFSDGYADTFGGKDNKKMTTKIFKQLLLNIQHKTMEEQKVRLNSFLENWVEGIEQIDDILVIGVRL